MSLALVKSKLVTTFLPSNTEPRQRMFESIFRMSANLHLESEDYSSLSVNTTFGLGQTREATKPVA